MNVLITDKEPLEPKKDLLSAVTPWTETVSKGAAAVVILVYVCGFLIVSLYHSQFGFVGTNPFRPRVLAAGVWYLFFISIPISVATAYRSSPWRHIAKNSAGLWIASYSTSIIIGQLFDFASPSVVTTKLTWSILLAVAWISLLVARHNSKMPEWVTVILTASVTLVYLIEPVRFVLVEHGFDTSSVALWFFWITIATITEFQLRTKQDLITDGGWWKPLTVVFASLFVFAQFYYPHLKASWGGGAPSDVTIYFTKDSLIDPGESAQAQLIDESDEGFYIVGPKESKAVFVPRSAVAMIYFGNKTADSSLLREKDK